MSTANCIALFPNWKEKATASERFSELSSVALQHPERFGRVAVVYEEKLPNGNTKVRTVSAGCTTNEMIGLLEIGKMHVYEDSQR